MTLRLIKGGRPPVADGAPEASAAWGTNLVRTTLDGDDVLLDLSARKPRVVGRRCGRVWLRLEGCVLERMGADELRRVAVARWMDPETKGP